MTLTIRILFHAPNHKLHRRDGPSWALGNIPSCQNVYSKEALDLAIFDEI